MKRKDTGHYTFFIFSLMSAGFMSLSAAGCHPHRRGNPDMEMINLIVTYKLDGVLDKIDATQDQRAEFYAAKDWILDVVEEGMSQKQADKVVVMEEMKSEAPDAERLHAILEERLTQRRQFAHDILDTILDLHAILTPEQRDRLFSLMEQHMKNGPRGFFGGNEAPHPDRRQLKKKIHSIFQ